MTNLKRVLQIAMVAAAATAGIGATPGTVGAQPSSQAAQRASIFVVPSFHDATLYNGALLGLAVFALVFSEEPTSSRREVNRPRWKRESASSSFDHPHE
jgi:hypothetical protein